MKKVFFILSIIFFSAGVNAQITVDSSDIGSVGDVVTIASDTGVTAKSVAPASATAQTFDYSNLNMASSGDISFLSPVGSIGASNFPSSNLMVSIGSDLMYTIKSGSSFEVDGIYGDMFGVGVNGAIDFNPDMLMITFPLVYTSTMNTVRLVDTVVVDTVSGIFDSLRLRSYTTITSLVDAYGTLNLPTMSEDVLRRYDVEITTDSIWGQLFGSWQSVQQSTSTHHYYRFIAKSKSYYMLEVEADPSGVVLTADFQTGGALIAGISQNSSISCNGGNDGYVEVSAIGGTSPYSYLWSNGQVGRMATSLTAGTYSVTITDNAGGTYATSAMVSEPDTMDISATQLGADHGLDDGFIFINVDGGTPSYVYLWSNGETSKNVEDLSFGIYTVTVTDNNGCTNSASFTVDDVTSVNEMSQSKVVSVYPNPSVGLINIVTTKDWGLTINGITGNQVYSATGTGKEVVDLSGLKSGVYFVFIKVDETIYSSKLHLIK
jgi:hypothetical protein